MRSSCGELQKDCKRLKEWMIKWKINFRADKYKVTYMGEKQSKFHKENDGL